jgi:hypothetical protein
VQYKLNRQGEQQMENNTPESSRTRRVVNDLILAEMFLLQATLESATIIGNGLSELGRQVTAAKEGETSPWDSLRTVVQRTADEALEPYSSRFKYLRGLE